jgi:hypothetical protein
MADKTIPAFKILRGNVGINTATPAFKIDVDGSAVFRGAASWAGNDNQNASIYLSTAGYGLHGNFANYARNLVRANSQYVEVGQNSTLVYGVKFIVGSNAPNGFMFQSNVSGSMTTHMSIRGDTGNVGIGTAGPSAGLEVYGSGHDNASLKITNAGSSNARLLLNSGHGNWSVCNSDTVGDALEFRDESAAATRMIIISSGSVGIGTANPQALFQCYSSAIIGHADQQTTQLTIEALNTAGSPAATTKILMKGYEGRGIGTFYTDSSYSGQEWFCGMNYAASFGYWNVGYDASGGQAEYNANTLFRVKYDGNVGINTSSPSAKLHVYTSATLYQLWGNNSVVRSNTGSHGLRIYNNDSGGSSLVVQDDGGSNTTFIVKGGASGSVGIGTASPSAKLHINETSTGTPLQITRTSNSGNGMIKFETGTTDDWIVGLRNDSTSNFRIYSYGTSSDVFSINRTDGNVGIGTDDPEATLTVAGPNYTHAIFRTNQSTASQRAGGGFSSLGHSTAASRFARLFLDADGANFGGTDYFTIEKFGSSGVVKLLQYSNANMSFWVNTSTEALTIKNDGNVGIGTNNPATLLDVRGAVTVGVNDTGHDVRFYGATSGRYWEWDESMDLVRMRDNVKAVWGNGDDLQLFHDGSNSYIQHGSTGALNITLNAGGEFAARFVRDAAVELYYNGTKKFETTSAGITVSGDAIIGSAATKIKTYSDSTYSGIYNGSSLASDESIYFGAGTTYFINDGSSSLVIDSNQRVQLKGTDYQLQYVSGSHIWYTRLQSNGTFAIHKNGVGDYLSVTSAGFVGIGTGSTMSSSNEKLGVYSASAGHSSFKNSSDSTGTVYIRNVSTTASTWQPYLILADSSGNRGGLALKYSTAGLKVHGQGGIEFWTGSGFGAGSRKMYLESSGNFIAESKVGIGDASPQTTLAVNGEASFGDGSRLSLIGLSIASSSTSPNIKIRTKIPFALGAADFTVNLKGFIYGNAETANLTICWHYYNSTFYNASCSSAGGWAPTIQLSAEDWDSSGTKKVCICLSTPGYWVKMYVESMFSHSYNDAYADGWTWVDGTASGTGNDLATASYKADFGRGFILNNNGVVSVGNNFTIPQGNLLYLDGGSNTYIYSDTADSIAIATGGSVRMTLNNSQVSINKEAKFPNNVGVFFSNAGGSSTLGLKADTSDRITFRTGGAWDQMVLDGNGNLGIGTNAPSAPLEVYYAGSSSVPGIIVRNTTNGGTSSILFEDDGGNRKWACGYNDATNDWRVSQSSGSSSGNLEYPKLVVRNGGNVGVGYTFPAYKLEVAGDGRFSTDLTIAGNVGINGFSPSSSYGLQVGGNAQVAGSFSASSKSFLIDHPTKENKKLEHGCLEGPEFGVYYRGRAQSNTITLPDYWTGLVRGDSITVQLTPKGSFQHLYVVSQSLTEIVIGAADGETIDCFYTIYGERADIDRLEVEKEV